MIDVNLALAFTTGLVATVNPCGFAMLPAYLSFFLGIEHERATVVRAFVVATAVTVGFAGTFAVVGLVVTRLTRSVYDVAPWVSLVIGALLLLFGVALLAGLDLTVRMPRLDRGGRSGDIASMALFGVSYAIASIGCELPLFLAAMSGAFNSNFVSGAIYFAVFGIGFGAVMVSLTVALAFARQSIVHTVRKVLPYVNRVAGALLVAAGAYVAWYGWVQIRSNETSDSTVRRVTGWSESVQDWMQQNRDLIGVAFAAALIAVVAYVLYNRRADVR